MKQREKIIELAESIIDCIPKEMIMPRVIEDFADDSDMEHLKQNLSNSDSFDKNLKILDKYTDIANKVYNQIKLRM
tara:strand:- start:4195 stop:4422 length:228 start_codon:yes stop_codon:yes gene_type:complete